MAVQGMGGSRLPRLHGAAGSGRGGWRGPADGGRARLRAACRRTGALASHCGFPFSPPCLFLPPEDYRKEQLDYFSYTAAWTDIHPSQVVGSAACFKAYDLLTVTLEELKAPLKVGLRAGGPGRGGRGQQ